MRGFKMKRAIASFIGVMLIITFGFSAFAKDDVTIVDNPEDYIDKRINAGLESTQSLQDLEGGCMANVASNEAFDEIVKGLVPNAKIQYLTNYSDTFLSVANGTCDFAFVFRGCFAAIQDSYPNMRFISSGVAVPLVAAFSDKGDKYRAEFNEYLSASWEDGTIDELTQKWLVDYKKHTDSLDFDSLPGERGTLLVGCSFMNAPYAYLEGGEFAGFDAAVLYDFCEKYGYKADIEDTAYDSVLTGIGTGKYDLAFGGYGYTKERSEGTHFSNPYLYDEYVFAVIDSAEETKGFWETIKTKLYKDFIEDHRYMTILSGLGVTLLITVLSVLLGSILGFVLFLAVRRSSAAVKVTEWIYDMFEALPTLIVLMIFFFGIFGKVKINGVLVSVLVFGLIFVFSTAHLLYHSVSGIDKMQWEGGLALGYTQRQTLFRIILPQAMPSFLTAYKSSIVNCLKGTAIVGYVAVTDLTRAGDLIRSRTFDAFIPLLAVALIYYILAKTLIFLLARIEVNPKKRTEERILKGVER